MTELLYIGGMAYITTDFSENLNEEKQLIVIKVIYFGVFSFVNYVHYQNLIGHRNLISWMTKLNRANLNLNVRHTCLKQTPNQLICVILFKMLCHFYYIVLGSWR